MLHTRFVAIDRELKHVGFLRRGRQLEERHFACQDSGVSQIVILIILNGENVLSNVNVVI